MLHSGKTLYILRHLFSRAPCLADVLYLARLGAPRFLSFCRRQRCSSAGYNFRESPPECVINDLYCTRGDCPPVCNLMFLSPEAAQGLIIIVVCHRCACVCKSAGLCVMIENYRVVRRGMGDGVIWRGYGGN